jgi:superfamily II DNA or RNA helicase
MELNAGARLGLSATPTRYGDADGTVRIFNYFGPIVPPPITLVDAIKAGRLVPYEYYPHAVHLTAGEAADWKQLTRAIQLEMSRAQTGETGKVSLTEKAKMLLIRRARIAKKASAKVQLAPDIVSKNFERGQSWLVYCEDSEQLANVMESLQKAGFEPVEYHSAMAGDRSATMSWFRSFGGILVSIRCLDEGVAHPAS